MEKLLFHYFVPVLGEKGDRSWRERPESFDQDCDHAGEGRGLHKGCDSGID